MAKQIVGLDKAHAFWGMAKDGKLEMANDKTPYLTTEDAREWLKDGYKSVKVYLLVEDE